MVVAAKRPRTFEVVFHDPNKRFYCSGDKVAGNVVLEVSEPTRVSAVRVRGVGCARVAYSKGKQKCRDEVEYLRYEEEVHLDKRDGDSSATLTPGKRYEFLFGFELPGPGRLASSHEGKFGYVRYYVRASMETPSQHAFQCEKRFEVEEPLDVNTPDLLAPAAASTVKKVTCMFIPDGQVSIAVKIGRKGFCEGEEIAIDAKFENTCSRIVVPKAAIVAKHSYLASGRNKVLRQKLCSVRGDHIISGMGDVWQGKSIRVPKLKPSLKGCDIIAADYALMIYVHIPGSEKLAVELPLVIGTIPYSGINSRTNSMVSYASTAGGGRTNSMVSYASTAGGGRTNSMVSYASTAGGGRTNSMVSYASTAGGGGGGGGGSCVSFPSAPPSYSNIQRELGADNGRTPLLDDFEQDEEDEDEEEEGGLFMRPPVAPYPPPLPPPPPYSEVDEELRCRTHPVQAV